MKYSDLQSLITNDQTAGRYYNSLPDYARDHINTRSKNVQSLDDLERIAESFLQGDK